MKPVINRTLINMLALATVMIGGCAKQKVNEDLGALPTVTFTATPLASSPNKIVFKSTTAGAFEWRWEFAPGVKSFKETDTFLYSAKGDYNVVLKAFNRAGYATTTQKVTIVNDYPGVNALKGEAMDAASAAQWKVIGTGSTLTAINWGADGLNFSNGTGSAQTNIVVYQAVSVVKGHPYKLSAKVKGAGATNTWFEVYLGTTVPVAGSDYSDNKFIALNTWSGCALSAFNDDISSYGCDGSGKGKNGSVTFDNSGTIYVVLKVGSWDGNLGSTGITIANVRLADMN